MALWQLVAIMMSLALASYIQTLTGFAFGLIVMGLLATLDVLPIESAALLCTLLGLFNNTMAMRGHWRQVSPRFARRLLVTSLPMLPVGYFLAHWLGEARAPLLGMLLGIVILIACLALLAQPAPRTTHSPRWHFKLAGALSGLMGGLFSANGPPLVVVLYRQPMTLIAVRCTLFAVFIVTGVVRMGLTLAEPGRIGDTLSELLIIGLFGTFVVIIFTELARRFPPPLSDKHLRQVAYAILLVASGNLILKGLI
ncbi:sulfite exporter TauE/SafE family protein [Cobetia sp. L2A1]|uniref:sulfite exporter TauE/SafE family protein n=1 Tax=Cobetia sp. L2A1 TaxID=2686360 RepID=UPI00131D5C9B|nr:sulfite exporter TauE/SafE family protein [Cobetia sp. L2A1]